jgi:hypothetical protein
MYILDQIRSILHKNFVNLSFLKAYKPFGGPNGLNFVPTLPFVNPEGVPPKGSTETNLSLTCIAVWLDFVDV